LLHNSTLSHPVIGLSSHYRSTEAASLSTQEGHYFLFHKSNDAEPDTFLLDLKSPFSSTKPLVCITNRQSIRSKSKSPVSTFPLLGSKQFIPRSTHPVSAIRLRGCFDFLKFCSRARTSQWSSNRAPCPRKIKLGRSYGSPDAT
jgi:hypothetical protein